MTAQVMSAMKPSAPVKAEVLNYDETGLVRALSEMSVQAMIAFAGACACRTGTAAASRGADMRFALQAIDQLRSFVQGGAFASGDQIEAQLIACIADEDEAPEFDASVVEDALAAAAYGFRCVANGDAMNAVWASRRAYDAVERYAGLRQNETEFTEEVEVAILSHPLVQSELQRQRRDVGDLGRMCSDPKKFATLIDRAKQEPLLG